MISYIENLVYHTIQAFVFWNLKVFFFNLLSRNKIVDFAFRLPQDIAQERMHNDIVELLVHYKVRNQNLQNGHVTGHMGAHPMMRDSYMGMKQTGSYLEVSTICSIARKPLNDLCIF